MASSSLLVPPGAQEPRVSTGARPEKSDGDDAVGLARAYGFALDVWQQGVLGGWLGIGDDGRWACPRCGLAVPRQNGKNGALEARELFGAVVLGERILHTAHEVKTARKHFARLLYFFDNPKRFPDLAGMVLELRKVNGQEAIILTNGGSIELAARSKGSGRGFSVDVLVIDEAQELKDDELEALLPTISASDNPQTIYLGTPPKGGILAGEVFLRVRGEGVTGANPRLCWQEWSIETQELEPHDKGEHPILDDRDVWAAVNPAMGVRLRLETIADERSDFSDASFARERLGMWPPVGAAAVEWVVPEEDWTACEDEASAPVGHIALAVDVSPARSWASISLAGTREDGRRHVEFVERQEGVKWLTRALVRLNRAHKPSAIVVDVKNGAGSLLPAFKAAGLGDVLLEVSTAEYGQACQMFYDDATEDGLRHLGDEVLTESLAAAKKRPMGDQWAWDRRDPDVDITPLVSASLALYGHVIRPEGESGDFFF